jgi:hypothetical protein
LHLQQWILAVRQQLYEANYGVSFAVTSGFNLLLRQHRFPQSADAICGLAITVVRINT